MKILIQNETSGLFWGSSGRWVQKHKKPLEFHGAVQALRFCFMKNMKGVRLLFAFRQASLNFFVSPFADRQAAEFGGGPDFRNSVLQVARNLAIQEANVELRRDLDHMLAERKLRRRKVALNLNHLAQARKQHAA